MTNRPSLGRSHAERGLDCFDTPAIALEPLFAHEPLLHGVITVAEPFAGKGNLVTAMRQRGLVVYASDIVDRGCPDCTVLDFLQMTERPPGCDVLISNPAYKHIMHFIKHVLKLGFRLIILLLETKFLSSTQRYKQLHPTGHLRRVHVLAERLGDMHDAEHIASGGKLSGQSRVHAWFVIDQDYCGPPAINPVSIKQPDASMPWAAGARQCAECGEHYRARRSDSRFCSDRCRQRAHRRRRDTAVTMPSRDGTVTAAALKLTQPIDPDSVSTMASRRQQEERSYA